MLRRSTGKFVALTVRKKKVDAFLFASQSNLQAQGTDPSYNSGVPIYPSGYSAPDTRIQIWNRATHAFETYVPFVNSEGVTGSTLWGPEYAFAVAWLADNPGKTIYLLKRAQGNTGIAADATQTDWAKSSGELYADVTTIVTEATAALAASGKTMSVTYAMMRVGEQDAKDSTKASNYATNLAAWITSSRIDWGYTRMCISLLHIEQLQSGFPYWSTVRTGMKSVADADQNVDIVVTDGATFVDQTLHINPAGIDKMGRDFYWAYAKGWTKFPYTGLGALADVANNRYVYPFVAGDLTTLKTGTIENVLSVTTTGTTARGYMSSLSSWRTDLAANAPRRTWASGRAQLVIEGQATNRALNSRDLTQAAWVKVNATAALDQSGIDAGTNSASSITATANNATVIQTIADATSRARYLTAYVKRLTGTGTVQMTMDGGTTWTTIAITGSFTRVSLTQTLAGPLVGFKLATSGDAIAVDYVMCEDGAFATSAFNSGGSAATRAVEDVRIKDTAIAQAAALTIVMKGSGAVNTAAQLVGADSQAMIKRTSTATLARLTADDGTTLDATAASGDFAGNWGVGFAGNASGRKGCFNGGTVVTDAKAVNARTSNPRLGMVLSGNATTAIGGFVDFVFVAPSVISDAQLQALAVAHQAV